MEDFVTEQKVAIEGALSLDRFIKKAMNYTKQITFKHEFKTRFPNPHFLYDVFIVNSPGK